MVLRKIFVDDHPDGSNIISRKGMEKNISKEKWCACIFAHLCVCWHRESWSTVVKFRISKSIETEIKWFPGA